MKSKGNGCNEVTRSNFQFSRHIVLILDKVKRVVNMFLHVIGCPGGPSTEVIYQQIIRPPTSYAFPIWFGCSSAQMESIRIWERRVLRRCLDLWRVLCRMDLFGYLRLVSLQNDLVKNCIRLDGRLQMILDFNYISSEGLNNLNRGFVFEVYKLPFYHRRFGPLDIHNTLYKTNSGDYCI